MTFRGMDAEAVEALASKLEIQADAINGVVQVVDGAVSALGGLWFGEDFGNFHASWGQRRPQAHAAAADIRAALTRLRAEIAEQRQASGGAFPGASRSGSAPSQPSAPAHPSLWDRLKHGVGHEFTEIKDGVTGFGHDMKSGLDAAAGGIAHGWNSFWDAEKKGWGLILTDAKNDTEQFFYHHPGLQDAVIKGLPWALEGGAFGLSTIVPGGPAILTAATGGHWPSRNYENAVGGLQQLGKDFGILKDDPRGLSVNTVTSTSSHPLTNSPVQDLLEMEKTDGYGGNDTPQIGVTAVHSPDGQTRYIVNIPGTEDWGMQRHGNVFDLTTNLQLMSGEPAAVTPAVLHAMEAAGIPHGADVMLVGHSQAGMTAMSIANDPQNPYHVGAILTAGAPTGQTHGVPSGTSVLSIEHNQDAVPRVDAAANPSGPNWTTIKTNLDADPAAKSGDPFAQAHDVSNYAQTAGNLQKSGQLDAWEQQNAQFLKGTPTGTKIVTLGK